MSDPFDALRKESSAENPPPRFVLELYRRLEQELNALTPDTQPGTQPVTDSMTLVHTAASCLDRFHGRAGRLADPFGHLWIVSAPPAPDRGARS